MKPWKSYEGAENDPENQQLQWGHGDEAVEEASRFHSGGDALRLQWGHGDEAVEECRRPERSKRRVRRFNGATAMKPWKRTTARYPNGSNGELQWGHGDEAVEEYEGAENDPENQQLQWGHGDEAVEEILARDVGCRKCGCFNGATAMKPWKRWPRPRSSRGTPSFNGATAMKPWKRS